jgi:peptide-methionine (S)-S-oxide reductase
VFGLGCFWGAEKLFWNIPGVWSTAVGYAGGYTPNPTYEEVCSGRTGHTEAVLVVFDPAVVSYERLLDAFWRNVDPTDDGGQFCDRGAQYVSVVYVRNERQRRLAETSKAALARARPFPILTPIRPATTFWAAEGYHQDYYRKNPVRYRFYKFNCGRKARLDDLWGHAGD